MKVSSSFVAIAALAPLAASAAAIVPRQASSAASVASSAATSAATAASPSSISASDSSAASSASGDSSAGVSSVTSSAIISASAPASASPSALPSFASQNLSSYANSSVHGPQGLRNANCRNITIPVSTNSSNIQYIDVDDHYNNQSYITNQVLSFANQQQAWISAHENGTFNYKGNFNVSATFCSPIQSANNTNSSLIVATHGIGFNKEYWNFLNDTAPEYSLINQATSEGYSILTYDRLGTGNTSHPESGFNETQIGTEVSLLANILTQLRNGTAFEGQQNFTNILGVGHSYGSAQMQALTATAPDLLDGVALTGYSNSSAGIAEFLVGGALTPANQVFPNASRFSNESSIYLVNGSPTSTYELFLWPPNYDASYAAIAAGPLYSDAVTLGQLTSQNALAQPASNFSGPVFVISGEHDLPFCGGNCQPPLLEGVKQLYPQAGNFSTFIEPSSGHGLVVGYTGPDSNRRVVEFFKSNNL